MSVYTIDSIHIYIPFAQTCFPRSCGLFRSATLLNSLSDKTPRLSSSRPAGLNAGSPREGIRHAACWPMGKDYSLPCWRMGGLQVRNGGVLFNPESSASPAVGPQPQHANLPPMTRAELRQDPTCPPPPGRPIPPGAGFDGKIGERKIRRARWKAREGHGVGPQGARWGLGSNREGASRCVTAPIIATVTVADVGSPPKLSDGPAAPGARPAPGALSRPFPRKQRAPPVVPNQIRFRF